MTKRFLTNLQSLACLLFTLPCSSVYGSQDQPFPEGPQLTGFTAPAADSQRTLAYPDLKTMPPHTISQIDGKLAFAEILSVLCPDCQADAPVVNRLYQTIRKDAVLSMDVKIIGLCIGNDKTQSGALKKSFKISFPLIPDEQSVIAHVVGVPETPTMVLVSHADRTLASYSGVLGDFDGLLKDLRENQKKQ